MKATSPHRVITVCACCHVRFKLESHLFRKGAGVGSLAEQPRDVGSLTCAPPSPLGLGLWLPGPILTEQLRQAQDLPRPTTAPAAPELAAALETLWRAPRLRAAGPGLQPLPVPVAAGGLPAQPRLRPRVTSKPACLRRGCLSGLPPLGPNANLMVGRCFAVMHDTRTNSSVEL